MRSAAIPALELSTRGLRVWTSEVQGLEKWGAAQAGGGISNDNLSQERR
jgi:hypothetical protein